MPDTLTPVKPSLSFAKLVATPTETAWSQAYNAGNLFACLALTIEAADDEISLPSLGKESLGILETEFFTLDEKNTPAIKNALIACLAKIPPDVAASMTVAFYKDTVLTVFIAGSGKAILKREDKIGVLLEKHDRYAEGEITSASGYLKHNDTVVLQTGAFAEGITHEAVSHALDLDLPNDIVEALSPQVHEQDNGAQVAIVIRFLSAFEKPIISEDLAEPTEQTLASLYAPETHTREDQHMHTERQRDEHQDEEEEIEEQTTTHKPKFKLPTVHFPKLPRLHTQLGHKRKFYLTIAIIISCLLIVSIFLFWKNQADTKQHEVFQSIYGPAEQLYEEAQGLESLNKPLSQEDYLKAKAKLNEASGKVSPNSADGKKIAELAAKIDSALNARPADNTSKTTSVTPPEHSLLAVEKDTADGLGFGQDGENVYVLTDAAITAVSKKTGDKKELIKNKSAWENPVAVVPYQGYLYVLDQKNGVIKYVGENKNNYFTSGAPDLTKASGMAIDGSIWIVTTEGKILKFTKGVQDTFGITGIDKPLNKPTKIITTIDMDYIYVLDNGNSRIVKLDKKGVVQKTYATSFAKTAKDFDYLQSEKQFLLYTNGKIYQLAE